MLMQYFANIYTVNHAQPKFFGKPWPIIIQSGGQLQIQVLGVVHADTDPTFQVCGTEIFKSFCPILILL